MSRITIYSSTISFEGLAISQVCKVVTLILTCVSPLLAIKGFTAVLLLRKKVLGWMQARLPMRIGEKDDKEESETGNMHVQTSLDQFIDSTENKKEQS